jgi:hypothetical protein
MEASFFGMDFPISMTKPQRKKKKKRRMYSHRVPVYLKSPKFEKNVLKIFSPIVNTTVSFEQFFTTFLQFGQFSKNVLSLNAKSS